MTGDPRERLFEAWREAPLPAPRDEAAGRARWLEAFAARSARPRRAPAWLAAAAIAVAACALLVAWWRAPAALTFTTPSGDGRAGAWLATDRAADLPLAFSEGTRVVLAADSRGRVEQLERSGAVFVLERGEVRARVVHRAGTSWRFRAGPFEVEVTGTALGVEWDPARERFAVRVDEGSVRVAGPRAGAVQVVKAGERCEIDLPTRTTRMSSTAGNDDDATDGADTVGDAGEASEPGDATEGAPADASTGNATGPSPRPPAASWTKLAEAGDYDAAYAAARATGLGAVMRGSSGDELLRFAQVSLLSGHRETGRDALLACRRRFAGSDAAAVAAYQLGRASPPAEAARWFSSYLAERPSGPLAREASGRLVEARSDSGDAAAAREAAARYLARYPDGPHAPLARRVLGGAP
jgi:transmembrane sensor